MIPLKDAHSLSKIPIWVILIILINAYIFFLEITAPSAEDFILRYSLIPSDINLNNISSLFPFLSSQFLHAGFLHIISNMIFLWVFGNNVEVSLGFILFPIFYLLSGVVAALTQYLLTPDASIPMLGASGAVAGVLGAYFALYPKNKIKTLLIIFVFVTIVDIPAYFLLFYWFITQFFSGLLSISFSTMEGGIAFLPHIGGFLFGWFAALPFLHKKQNLHPKFFS